MPGSAPTVRSLLAAGSLVLGAAGCGQAGGLPAATAPAPSAGPVSVEVTSSRCSATARSGASTGVQCVFVLTDGRRFSCSGLPYASSTPRTSARVNGRACTRLRSLAIPAALRLVLAGIEKTRACLTARGIRVTGGPAFPGTGDAARSPVGELAATNGGGSALIAFYHGAARARLLEPEVVRNAQRFGGRVERRGAATVLWLGAPDRLLRGALRACALH